MRVLYYMEKELANFDPSRPGPPNGRVERGGLDLSLRRVKHACYKVLCALPALLLGRGWGVVGPI